MNKGSGVSVKSHYTFSKFIIGLFITIYSGFIIYIMISNFSSDVANSMVKIQMLIISSLLGISIWDIIQETSTLDAGQFKEIYKPDYFLAGFNFIALFIVAAKTNPVTYKNVMVWSGSGLGVVILALVVAVKGNSLATGKAVTKDTVSKVTNIVNDTTVEGAK